MEDLKCPKCAGPIIYAYETRASLVTKAKNGEVIIERNNFEGGERVQCLICGPSTVLPTRLVEEVKRLNRVNKCEARLTWLTQ